MDQRFSLGRLAGLSLGLLIALPAWSASSLDGTVRLRTLAPIGKGIAAMPLIADPADPAQQHINAALQQLDARLRKRVAACRNEGGRDAEWERSVTATMRGPRFLSLMIIDNADCGGAHPSIATMSIVYDLTTGAPVDWTQLLPASLTGHLALASGLDGTRMITLSSKRLYELYLAGYDRSRSDADCKAAVRDDSQGGPPAMMAWLDAKAGGLAVQFDLPHADEACADPVVITLAALRQEGASPVLLQALEAGQAP